ncbi:MAG: MCE family protein [Chitinophagales bacterium]|nr:MCE family protein [Chitinophagales bacterium]
MKTPFNKRSAWATFILLVLVGGGLLVYKYGYMVYQEYDYYTYYEHVNGLQRSNPVLINGVRVGEVSDIVIEGPDKKVAVTMSINKKTKIPKGTIARLASTGLLGGKLIELDPGAGPGMYTHKDVLKGTYDTTIMDMNDQIEPIVESVKYILGTADKNFSNFNRKLDNGLVANTQRDARDMEKSMSKLNKQVSSIRNSADKIVNSLQELRSQSEVLDKKSEQLDTTIKNAEASTASFAAKEISKPLNELRSTIETTREQATKLERSDMVDKMLNDDKTYKNTDQKLQKVNTDMNELKEHPKGFRLIGGK